MLGLRRQFRVYATWRAHQGTAFFVSRWAVVEPTELVSKSSEGVMLFNACRRVSSNWKR